MKLIKFVVFLIICFFAFSCSSSGSSSSQLNYEQITETEICLSWDDPNSPEAGILGYKVYIGNNSRDYTEVIDVNMEKSLTMDDLTEGLIYYFAVTAYNATAESDYSNEVEYECGEDS
jgi:fibronectin type 3 domain-containing protein